MGISGCCAVAVPSKQAKQTSKGLVLGAGAVRWRCKVRVYPSKGLVWFGVWCGVGAKQTKQGKGAKQRLGAGCGC